MATYLKIENPGVCPTAGFILLGASSKRIADNDSPYCIGQFGSGCKHAAAVCLRNNVSPVVFCGTLRLDFFTKSFVFSTAKYASMLGFAPSTKFSDGAAITARWYREKGLL